MAHPQRRKSTFSLIFGTLLVLGTIVALGPGGSVAQAGQDRVYRHSYDRMTEEEERQLEQDLEEALSHLDGLGEEISHIVETALGDLEIDGRGNEIIIRGLPRDDQFDLHTEELERHMEILGERLGERMGRLAERLSEQFESADAYEFHFDHESDLDDSMEALEHRMERLKRELRSLERELERRGY